MRLNDKYSLRTITRGMRNLRLNFSCVILNTTLAHKGEKKIGCDNKQEKYIRGQTRINIWNVRSQKIRNIVELKIITFGQIAAARNKINGEDLWR